MSVCTDKDNNKLEIEVINFAEPLVTANKEMNAAVLIKYQHTDTFYCIELYEQPIHEKAAMEAVGRIKIDPTVFKNQ